MDNIIVVRLCEEAKEEMVAYVKAHTAPKYQDLVVAILDKAPMYVTDKDTACCQFTYEGTSVFVPINSTYSTLVHELAHAKYEDLSVDAHLALMKATRKLCSMVTDLDTFIKYKTPTPIEQYLYSTVIDAYTIWHQVRPADGYVWFGHKPGYGADLPKVYATQEAFANMCELLFYGIEIPDDLKEFAEVVDNSLNEIV